jgi:hypothetical protein
MEAAFGSEGMTATGPKECPNADDIGAPLHLFVQAFDRVRGVLLGAVLAWEFAPLRRRRQTVLWTV